MHLNDKRWVLLHHLVGDSLVDRVDHYDFMVSSKGFLVPPKKISGSTRSNPVSSNGILEFNRGSESSSVEATHSLWTWAISTNPLNQPLPLQCVVERLPDHREAYLDYEGPISNDRGRVQQVASGSFEVNSWSKSRIELRVQCCGSNVADQERLFSVLLVQQGEVWSLRWSSLP